MNVIREPKPAPGTLVAKPRRAHIYNGQPAGAAADKGRPMIVAIRPFVPSKNFAVSKQFYEDLGFRITPFGEDLAQASLEGHSFFLQNFYERHFAGHFVMHMLVTNLDDWWRKIGSLALGQKYGIRDPVPPKDEPWGLTVLYVIDPSGVLWHIAQRQR